MAQQNGGNTKRGRQQSNATAMTRNSKYYIPDGDLRISIGSTEFRVHSYFFSREATAFFPVTAGSTNDNKPPANNPTDRRDHQAIVLENVSVSEFERFLWVFYNEEFNIYETSLSEWLVIFKLASRWGFSKIGKFAMREIKKHQDNHSVVDWIVMFEQNEAPKEILLPLFAKLCMRDTTITDEEVFKLSPERAIQIFRIREDIRSPGGSSPVSPKIKEIDVFPSVERLLFRSESRRQHNGE
ncbi:hypothetical protein FA15DRAFT_641447 [Coprinopsis marcescibilis]|uniref:BTB domain-containing protein n=1 Tax=Coprinopsis marcescibilis TaxID=230819 RepID=A0A5C3KVD6_COPMA|nr:hypothetical protein FA15DRAFT_641447 [Coprinopsis marcescibilis]